MSEPLRWQVGDVRITRIQELEAPNIRFVVPDATIEELGKIDERVHVLASLAVGERDRALWFVKRLVEIGQTGRLHVLAREEPSAALREALAGLLPEDEPVDGAA